MHRVASARRAVTLALAMTLLPAGPARADDLGSNGGASAPGRPVIDAIACSDGHADACPVRGLLMLRGSGLDAARAVLFEGRRGKRDDRRARPRSRSSHELLVRVPTGTRPGPIRVLSEYGTSRRGPRLARILPPAPGGDESVGLQGKVFVDGRPISYRYRLDAGVAGTVELVRLADGAAVASWPAEPGPDGSGEVRWNGLIGRESAPVGRYGFRLTTLQSRAAAAGPIAEEFSLYDHIFPIRGRHDLGQTATNNFGGGRGHQGQDMFARCGAPLVAARGGKVQQAGFQSRAGNYVVVQRSDGRSYTYMHMRRAPLVEMGDRVYTGQPIGEVGETGRATGCHLHFEMWSPPGWYEGGEPFDPLPELRDWDDWS